MFQNHVTALRVSLTKFSAIKTPAYQHLVVYSSRELIKKKSGMFHAFTTML